MLGVSCLVWEDLDFFKSFEILGLEFPSVSVVFQMNQRTDRRPRCRASATPRRTTAPWRRSSTPPCPQPFGARQKGKLKHERWDEMG